MDIEKSNEKINKRTDNLNSHSNKKSHKKSFQSEEKNKSNRKVSSNSERKNSNIENKMDSLQIKRINDMVQAPAAIENFSLCDKYLAIARRDNTIDIWDINSWTVLIKICGLKSKF
jgi:hypothetical protein